MFIKRKNLEVVLLVLLIFSSLIFFLKASSIRYQRISLKPKLFVPQVEASGLTAKDKPILTFGVVSDIHVQAKNKMAKLKFLKMLSDVKEHLNIHTLIINGDLGNGSSSDYAALRKLIGSQANNLKIFYTIGNHEFYQAYVNPKTKRWSPKTFPNNESDQTAINRFLSYTGQSTVYYDKYISGYHFIFLGSEKSALSGKRYRDKTYLSTTQIAWFQKKLKENYVPHKPIFVFLHQPFPTTTSSKEYRSIHNYVLQEDQLRTLLSNYPEVIVFSGHTHWLLGQGREIMQGPFNVVNDSSVEMPVDHNGVKESKESQGLQVTVYKDQVVIQGRDFANNTWITKAIHKINLSKE
ncbi:metallophosphoesterase [Desulfosporosinus sp. FKB]|uniref:metallophosphoesterase family protein n=1 Tax=Desulfosporosinus sp. FKB TaxID=1969835 RepID=UPI001483C057|nr:metallophosphoesterase [Desulfosporosinus sp. FKB]